MSVISFLSMVVYGHHMFVVGMSPLLSQGFMTLTMLISIPSAVFFLNWLGTMWRGSIRFATPMLFSVGVVFVFGLGGLTASTSARSPRTSTSTTRTSWSAISISRWRRRSSSAPSPRSTSGSRRCSGKMMNETLGKWHFWLTIVPIVVVFCGMLIVGYGGMQRRLYKHDSYAYLQHCTS